MQTLNHNLKIQVSRFYFMLVFLQINTYFGKTIIVFTNSSFWLVSSGILWYIWIWNTLSRCLFVLSDLWRPCSSTGDGLRNGDVCSSSLAAKGYRSVRPIFQDKTSPTPVRSACLLHSFVFLILAVAGGFPSSGNACGSPFDRFY